VAVPPRFDSPSVFGALLDRSAGAFRLAPFGASVPAARRYEPGTNVLETTWMTSTGWLVIRDAMTMAREHRGDQPYPSAQRSRR
jgi:GH15 family glucan-1,4-alpha-glucosidase